jgi:hypothetical protein
MVIEVKDGTINGDVEGSWFPEWVPCHRLFLHADKWAREEVMGNGKGISSKCPVEGRFTSHGWDSHRDVSSRNLAAEVHLDTAFLINVASRVPWVPRVVVNR